MNHKAKFMPQFAALPDGRMMRISIVIQLLVIQQGLGMDGVGMGDDG